MSQAIDDPGKAEVSIGLIGPLPAVRLMQSVARDVIKERESLPVRVVNAAVPPGSDPREHYLRVSSRVNAVLFAGQLQYDRARAGTERSAPATYVTGTETSLYAALFRAYRAEPFDLAAVSIDSLTSWQVAEAYAELGIDSSAIPVAPYVDPQSVESFADFHLEVYRSGRSQLALTTRSSVSRTLRQLDVPVHTIQPTRGTIREALERAIGLAGGARLGEQQIAFAFVQVLTDSVRGTTPSPAYWEQEAGLAVHRLLIEESRRIGGVVSRRSDLIFGVTMTRGGLDELAEDLQVAPFVVTIRERLGLPVAVGLGTGSTAIAAELNAGNALAASIASDGASVVLIEGEGSRVDLDAETGSASQPSISERERAILARLRENSGNREVIFDVDDVSRALDVTTRTGHRILTSLVESGLAWPLPTLSTASAGRPRKRYRLREAPPDVKN